MNNQIKNYEGTDMENYAGNKKKKWIGAIVCIVISLISIFLISKWATSVETYSSVIGTLNSLQKKALELTGTSTALATAAAAIPGEAATPVANKLIDLVGYMVIVYMMIIVEKYLLTLMGFVAFKILLPIGLLLAAVGRFLRTEWKTFVYRMAVKCIVLGILLWCLVPVSVCVTNWINDTYESSRMIDLDLAEEREKADTGDADENQDEKNDSGTKEDSEFSISSALEYLKNKAGDVVEDASEAVSEKVTEFEDALNRMIEGVAVMIVTTCVIPILVMLAFLWILKIVAGLNLPVMTVQSLPKASKHVGKRKSMNIPEKSKDIINQAAGQTNDGTGNGSMEDGEEKL